MSDFSASMRLMRAGWVLTREGIFASIPVEGLTGPAALAQRIAKMLAKRGGKSATRELRLARAINRLGPSYVKLGQFLATRPDIVGKQFAQDL